MLVFYFAAGSAAVRDRCVVSTRNEMNSLQRLMQLEVGELVKWVEIRADRAGEQDGILRDDG
jgi:hypothetical protein